MATYQDNNAYLKLDSVEVSAFFKDVQITPSNATVDMTHGAGVDHIQRGPGLNDHSLSITLTYDVASIQTYIQKLKAGATVTVEYGPEGAVSGKPRHVQDFIVTGAPFTVSVTKSEVTFAISGDAADAPSVDMYSGGVYS